MELLAWMLKTVCFIFGSTLLAHSLLTYETEEKQLVGYLEAAWVKVDDASHRHTARLFNFLRQILTGTNAVLTRVYGVKLVGANALLVSICLVYGFFKIAFELAFREFPIKLSMDEFYAITMGMFFIVVGLFMSGLRIVAAIYAIWSGAKYFFAEEDKWSEVHLSFGVLIFVGLFLDFLAIAVVRLVFFRAANAKSLIVLTLLSGLGVCVVPILIIASACLTTMIVHQQVDLQRLILYSQVNAFLNFVPIATSLLFGVLFLGSVILRLVYVLAPRIIYSTLKTKLFDSRKSSATLGAALVGFAISDAFSFAEKFTKWIA